MAKQSNPGKKKLTPKQELFCREYLVDLNQRQAAIRAGYSERSAHSIADETLKKPEVQDYIQELMNSRAQKVEITAEKVLTGLDNISELDIAEAYDEKGNLKHIHDIPKHIRKCIASIEVFEEFEGFGKDRVKVGEVRKVKFYDKIKAKELLGRHLKLYTDKVEHSGSIGSDLSDEDLDARIKKLQGVK